MVQDQPGSDSPGPDRRVVIAAVALTVLAITVAASILWNWRDKGPETGSSSFTFSCITTQDSADFCDRAAEEFAQRPLSDEQRRRAPEALRLAGSVIGSASFDRALCRTSPAGCDAATGPSPTAEDGAEAIRRALAEQGYPGTARPARPDDVGPAGTVVYALYVEEVCVVGFTRLPRGGGSSFVAGTLPDGSCLKP